jgi:hypothetical protein
LLPRAFHLTAKMHSNAETFNIIERLSYKKQKPHRSEASENYEMKLLLVAIIESLWSLEAPYLKLAA